MPKPARLKSAMERPFNSLYSHGMARVAVCIPKLRVADPEFNVERTIDLAKKASGCAVALFPELGISAYSNDDLFQQDALLDAVKSALSRLIKESEELTPMVVVGAPLRLDGKLFNCGAIVYRGRVLGVAPKTY